MKLPWPRAGWRHRVHGAARGRRGLTRCERHHVGLAAHWKWTQPKADGTAAASGVANLRALANFMNEQAVPCELPFQNMTFATDAPVLVLSEGKTMLPVRATPSQACVVARLPRDPNQRCWKRRCALLAPSDRLRRASTSARARGRLSRLAGRDGLVPPDRTRLRRTSARRYVRHSGRDECGTVQPARSDDSIICTASER